MLSKSRTSGSSGSSGRRWGVSTKGAEKTSEKQLRQSSFCVGTCSERAYDIEHLRLLFLVGTSLLIVLCKQRVSPSGGHARNFVAILTGFSL